MRVALATAASEPSGAAEGPVLSAALTAAGVAAEWVVWDDPTVDWAAYALVVVRSTWDYFERSAEFGAWVDLVAAATPLANPASVLHWNGHKSYLRDLATLGAPVTPTRWLEPGQPLTNLPWKVTVVKPAVSAGAWRTARYERHQRTAATDHVGLIHADGVAALLQPYLPEVDSVGERSVVVIDGRVSHVVRKMGLLPPGAGMAPDDEPRGYHQDLALVPLEPDDHAVAAGVLAAVARAVPGTDPLLYARVDWVPTAEGPRVMEVELVEPSLFCDFEPAGAGRLAVAVVRRLSPRPGPW